MHQQAWLDLWQHFLAVMSAETIETRIAIGITIAFFLVMSLTGIADSFLPRRAALRYAAMYDLMPALPEEPAHSSSLPPAETLLPDAPAEEEESIEDMRYAADDNVNVPAPRRSAPIPPKVFRVQKP